VDLRDWLFNEARYTTDPGELLLKLCEKLNEKSFGLMRCMLGIRTLHPEVSVELYVWQRDARGVETPQETVFAERARAGANGGINRISLGHGAYEAESYKRSPLYVVVEQGIWVHRKITATQLEFDFPILRDLQAVGATDYIAAPMRFTTGPLSTLTWVTDKPGGFSGHNIAEFEILMPYLAACFEIFSLRHTTASLVRTYLGADPGGEVLAGHVKPGDVRSIEAAIWFSDLRGFTQLSGELPTTALIATLNDYFTAQSVPIAEHGGEILKFIGDAMLVIFPVRSGRNKAEACKAAVLAARAANDTLEALNADRAAKQLPPLNHGIGLHFGTAEYGNIGAPGRLDFTVIGNDVNRASRIESLCGKLGQRMLATDEIVQNTTDLPWQSAGIHDLKGISGGVEVFTV